MFKKAPHEFKTSAPLRSSDRRKLRQRVMQAFAIAETTDGDLLVPDGLLSAKYSTHLGEPGVVYLSPEGDPLWFTLGKGSDDLIPSIYTLWKRPSLLPVITTPAVVLPVIMNGADLMAPGVVTASATITENQLVSVAKYERGIAHPPFAVGRMATSVESLKDETKGKAVYVLHTWKDTLWQMGAKTDPPDGVSNVARLEDPLPGEGAEQTAAPGENTRPEAEASASEVVQNPASSDGPSSTPISPQEISDILRTSLIQSIHTTLSALPPGGFPIPASIIYSTHILSSRPASIPAHPNPSTPIDIKHSTHKSLTAFLKAMERDGLLKLKEMKSDLVVMSVSTKHPEVLGHHTYRTLAVEQAKRERREEQEEAERSKVKEIVVVERWKPHQQSLRFFEAAEKDVSALYTLTDLRDILNEYVAKNDIVNKREQQYIDLDNILTTVVTTQANEPQERMKREELTRALADKMQPWYEVQVDGKDPMVKKGKFNPISIVVKMRQGRKACTLITNFEPFLLEAESLAEELRRSCASSTSITPLPGKAEGMEVMVQGKQIKAVTALLLSRGVPKKWIESVELPAGKKK